MRKPILIIAAILLVTIGTGVALAFQSLTSVSAAAITPQAEITKTEGDVRYKTAGTVEWQTAKIGTTLGSNDMIETGSGASAEINFYDNARAQLGEKTNITLTMLYVDEQNPNNNQVKIKLSLGRLWNRIISLVDTEASYEVETSNTVSTVRGTAFDISIDEQGIEEISMVENNIDIQLKNLPEKTIALGQNKHIRLSPETIKKDAPLPEPQDIPESARSGAWLTINQEQDKEFDAVIKERVQKNEAQLIKLSPENPFYGMQRFAESVRVQLAPASEKENLQNQFTIRRAAEAGLLMQEGKSEKALEHINTFLPSEAQPNTRPSSFVAPLQNSVRQIIIDKKDGVSPEIIDRLRKQNILREGIHSLSPLPATQKPPLPQNDTAPREDAPAVPTAPIPGSIAPLSPTAPTSPLPLAPQPSPSPTPAPTPTTSPTAPTSSTIAPPPAPAPSPAPTPVTVLRLELRAPRTNIPAGDSLQLKPVFILSNGTTASPSGCTFSVSGDPIGSIDGSGLLRTKSPGGIVSVTSQCTDPSGKNFSASITVTALLLVPLNTTPIL